MEILNNNIYIRSDSPVNRLNNLGFNILAVLFWIAQIWAPVDIYVTQGETTFLQRFFNSPFLFSKMLTPFEITVIFLSLFLLATFKGYYIKSKFFSWFFWLNIIIVILSLINPNNKLTFIYYFVGQGPRILYLFLLFLFAVTFLRNDIYNSFISKMFKIGSTIAVLLAIYSFILFLIGKGMIWSGRNVTISQGDTLEWMVIFQIIFFMLYFQYKRKKHLIISLLLFMILLFSYRRTGLLECIFIDFSMIVFQVVKIKSIFTKLKRILSYGFVLIILLFSLQYFLPENMIYDFGLRYLGAFSFFTDQNIQYAEYSDSGHMLQAITTTRTFFNNIGRFWGSGYKSGGSYYVEGQSAAIHNSFVNAWATYGLYMTIYLLILTIIFILKSINIFFAKNQTIETYSFIKIAFIFYLALFFIVGWSNGQSFLGYIQYLTKFVLLVSLLKLDKSYINRQLHIKKV